MAKRPAKKTLNPAQRKDVEARLAQICFYGTPEKDYADSGLWDFLQYVQTFDEHDDVRPYKLLPVKDKIYMQIIFYCLLKHKLLLLPKSRQIMMTWILAAFCMWFARTAPRRRILWQSEKEEKACSHVSLGADAPGIGRMDKIEKSLPPWLRDPYIASGQGNRKGFLQFSPDPIDPGSGVRLPWAGSSIRAIAQGARQAAGETITLHVGDEAAHQDMLEEALGAILPAIHGGGRVALCSSVYQGTHFVDMCLSGLDDSGRAIAGTEWLHSGLLPEGDLPHGMRYRINPSSYLVVETHYSSDPAKDPSTKKGAAWREDYSKGFEGGLQSSKWQTEMEINYLARGGRLVFPFASDLSSPVFIEGRDPQWYIKNCRLYAGYDYGTTNPSAFVVWGFDDKGQAFCPYAWYSPCENYVEHCERIKASPYFPHLARAIVADPSILHDKRPTAHGLKSVAELFAQEGVRMRMGRKGKDYTTALQFKGSYWADPTKPLAFIDLAGAGAFAREIMGLRYETHRSQVVAMRKNNPEKIEQKNNHGWDATSLLIDSRPSGLVLTVDEKIPYHSVAWARGIIDENNRRKRRFDERVQVVS